MAATLQLHLRFPWNWVSHKIQISQRRLHGDIMNTTTLQDGPRKLGAGLIIGIVLLPFVFAWFTLRKGYSTAARVASFVWAGLILLAVVNAPSTPGVPTAVAAPAAQGAPVQAQAAPAPVQIPRMTAVALFNQYKENEVAADEKFKGKTMDVEGTVEKISKDFTDEMYVVVKAGEMLTSINGYFDDSHKSALASLKPGQRVILRGRVDGFIMNMNVVVKGCQLVQ